MAPLSSIDDPGAISNFLSKMRRDGPSSMLTEPDRRSTLNPESTDFSPQGGDKNMDRVERENMALPSNVVFQAAQQLPAWQASAQSPFPQATSVQKSNPAELFQDGNGFVAEAPAPAQVLSPQNRNVLRSTQTRPMTATQYRLLAGMKPGSASLTEQKLAELRKQTEGYMDNVVEKMRNSQAQGQGKAAFIDSATPVFKQEKLDTPDSLTFPEFDETPINAQPSKIVDSKDSKSSTFKAPPVFDYATSKKDEWVQEKSTPVPFNTLVAEAGEQAVAQEKEPTIPFPSFGKTAITKPFGAIEMKEPASLGLNASIVAEDNRASSTGAISSNQEQERLNSGMVQENKAEVAQSPIRGITSPAAVSPTIVVTGAETDESSKEEDEEEEDRENLARFKSWGTPTARNKPKSRQRTIILSGLPRTDDLTFVQSFIYGGAIECMRLVPGNPDKPTISAHVTFVAADSCDRYYDKYPNGFDVRYHGKKYPVVVTRKEGIDVISGMLQGYLECGATRVVKVSNADDDWGVVALNKLAKGKNAASQVEAVQDIYHGGTRIITFRFGNITHAVQFKGMIIRSDDWEGSYVEFSEDPCAKATGFHND